MSHRKQSQKLRPEPTKCPACGSDQILYGKRHGLCKGCRLTIKKPRSGWVGPDGNPIRIRVAQCKKCAKLYGLSEKKDEKCPVCGSEELEVIAKW